MDSDMRLQRSHHLIHPELIPQLTDGQNIDGSVVLIFWRRFLYGCLWRGHNRQIRRPAPLQ